LSLKISSRGKFSRQQNNFGNIYRALSGKDIDVELERMYFSRQAATPAMPPPINLDNHGKNILAVTGFFTGFSCFVVLARLYVRIVILEMISMDDYVMSVAMVHPSSHHHFLEFCRLTLSSSALQLYSDFLWQK
jgi:hypothetical protein